MLFALLFLGRLGDALLEAAAVGLLLGRVTVAAAAAVLACGRV